MKGEYLKLENQILQRYEKVDGAKADVIKSIDEQNCKDYKQFIQKYQTNQANLNSQHSVNSKMNQILQNKEKFL